MKRLKLITTLHKIVLLCLALSASETLLAQNFFGLRVGAGAGNVRFVPYVENEFQFTAPQFGVSYKHYGGLEGFGGVECDLTYQNRGYKVLDRVDSDSAYIREINTLQINFMWQPHVTFGEDKHTIFANVGPFLNYNISATERYVTKELGEIYNREYEFSSMKDNRLGYGLVFGLGYGYMINSRLELFCEVRYDWGFSDIMKDVNKYPANMLLESPMDYLSGAVGVFYKFGRLRKTSIEDKTVK